MKKILKKIYNFCYSFYLFFESVFLVAMLSRKSKSSLESISRKCVVLGNGPSLINDLGKVYCLNEKEDIDVWCVNFFCLDPEFLNLKPAYYCLADPSLWSDSSSQELKEKLYRMADVLNSISWNITLVIPYESEGSYFLRSIKNKNIDIFFYNNTPIRANGCVSWWFFDRRLAIYPAYNVLIPSLIIPISLGYEKVYIYGADHSWHESLSPAAEGAGVFLRQLHFYDQNNVASEPMRSPEGQQYFIDEMFLQWAYAFKGYRVIRMYAEKKGCKIYSCGTKTYIDAFEFLR